MTTFLEFLRDHQRFLLAGHENPDGDCLGSQLALRQLLEALGKEAVIVNPDPIGKSFEFLGRHAEFGYHRGEGELPEFDAVILLDCSTLSRLGVLGKRLRGSGKPVGVIDHHVGGDDGDGHVYYVDTAAAATGVLVRRLFAEFDLPLEPVAAEGMFLAIVSDTGWFRYSNSDSEVFAQASELVAAGVDVGALYDNLYRRRHPESAGVLAVALRRHQFHCQGQLVVVALDKAIMERAVRIDFDTDSVLEPLRSIEGVEIVALLKERFDGAVKLSMRARGEVDVQQICSRFGGGGHRKASGATLDMPLAQAERVVVDEAQRALLAYRESGL